MIEPRPAELNRKLAMIEALVRDIRKEYAWTHGWANSPGRSGDSLEGKISGGDNDEVGSIVVSRDKAAARRKLQQASANLDEALALTRVAWFQLQKAIKQRDPMPTKMGPALLSRADRRESHAAQQRREARGEGFAQ